MKGFKVFNPDWTCRGFKYEVGQIYEEQVKPSLCDRGFHFCEKANDCFKYYGFDSNNKVAEIEALGLLEVGDDKCCTNKIKIVREITWHELLEIINIGKNNTGRDNTGNRNTGNRNTGNWNTGNWNTGDWNTGSWNTGSWNTGNWNTGSWNTGDWNTGNCNTGDWNTGNCNTGDRNTGNWNTGNWNTGNWNTGSWNTGDWNTGDWNTGDWNMTDRNTGCFNIDEHNILFFDKESNVNYDEWINHDARYIMSRVKFRPTEWICESDMTDQEKNDYPTYETTCGYLKEVSTAECYEEWWNELDGYEKSLIKTIPNFDADKFYKITGIKVD